MALSSAANAEPELVRPEEPVFRTNPEITFEEPKVLTHLSLKHRYMTRLRRNLSEELFLLTGAMLSMSRQEEKSKI